MKFIVAHTLAFLLALAAFALYIVSFNTPFYSIAKKCKLPHRFNLRVVLFFFLFVRLCWFFSSDLPHADSTKTTDSAAALQQVTSLLNITTDLYDVKGITRTFEYNSKAFTTRAPIMSNWDQNTVSGSVRQVFYVIYIFLVLGILSVSLLLIIILALFFRGFQIRTLALPQKVYRFFLFFLAFLSFTGAFIAFFNLRQMPDALKKAESTTVTCSDGYCQQFSGSTTLTQSNLQYDVSWGPDSAWYTSLAAYLASIPLAFIVLINRVPLLEVTDDVTSGYAL
jgi:hypothetical protein